MGLELVRTNNAKATIARDAIAYENMILKLNADISKLSQTQSELLFCITNIVSRPVMYMVKFESDVCDVTARMTVRLYRISRLIRIKQYAIGKLKNKLRTAMRTH